LGAKEAANASWDPVNTTIVLATDLTYSGTDITGVTVDVVGQRTSANDHGLPLPDIGNAMLAQLKQYQAWNKSELEKLGLDDNLCMKTGAPSICLGPGSIAAVGGAKAVTAVLAKIASGEAAAGANLVYYSVNAAGEVTYVGITNRLERRAGEHLSSKALSIDAIPGLGNLSRADARSIEQVLVENHGLARDGGTLMNKINSISTSNPAYAAALQRGAELLRQAGYSGF
jgi:hypothetical protein